jgi:hypothetical protein
MQIDTTKTIEIAGSPWKMIGLTLGSALMTAACVAIIAGYIPGATSDDFRYWLVAIGIPFFGFCTLLIGWRAFKSSGGAPVVTLSPTGLLDTRVSAAPIPWTAIRDISTWSYKGQKIMVLDVDPKIEATLPLTKIASWSRGANKSLGADGLCVTAQGLKMGYDELLMTSTVYAEAAVTGKPIRSGV